MRTFLLTTLPTIIILVPIAGQLIYRLFVRSNHGRKIIISGIIALLIGLIAPWIAMLVSVHGHGYGVAEGTPICATGAVTFIGYGYLINIIGIPFLGLFLYALRPFSKKQTKNTTQHRA